MENRGAPDRERVSIRITPSMHPMLPIDARTLAVLCERILDFTEIPHAPVGIVLTDDREMSRLNQAYRGVPGPTNVLSFPEQDEESLGQVALSVETLLRESFLYGQPPLSHMSRLLTHAFLHLAGLEHGPIMDRLTDEAVVMIESEFITR